LLWSPKLGRCCLTITNVSSAGYVSRLALLAR
jgi:hypothetical protein